jgi:nicotinamidase-related amidase
MNINPKTSAVLLVDLQNDYLHESGAYARGGVRLAADGLIDRTNKMLQAARAAGLTIVSVNYTVPWGRDQQPLFRPEFKQRYPFLATGDFAPGTFGHAIDSRLLPVDMTIEKVFPSAFVQSRLEMQLSLSGITDLFLCGITTNNGVAATFYDARRIGFRTIVIGDCCAAVSQEVHEGTLKALGGISPHSPVIDGAMFATSLAAT